MLKDKKEAVGLRRVGRTRGIVIIRFSYDEAFGNVIFQLSHLWSDNITLLCIGSLFSLLLLFAFTPPHILLSSSIISSSSLLNYPGAGDDGDSTFVRLWSAATGIIAPRFRFFFSLLCADRFYSRYDNMKKSTLHCNDGLLELLYTCGDARNPTMPALIRNRTAVRH